MNGNSVEVKADYDKLRCCESSMRVDELTDPDDNTKRNVSCPKPTTLNPIVYNSSALSKVMTSV